TEELQTVFDKLEGQFKGDKENEKFFQRVLDMNDEIQEVFLENFDSGDISKGQAVYAQVKIRSLTTDSVIAIQRLVNAVTELQHHSAVQVENSMDRSIITLIVATIINVLSGLVIMFIISRTVSGNLKKIVSITKA